MLKFSSKNVHVFPSITTLFLSFSLSSLFHLASSVILIPYPAICNHLHTTPRTLDIMKKEVPAISVYIACF